MTVHLHLFIPREQGHQQHPLKNQVPAADVKNRFDRLLKQVQRISTEMSGKDVGKTMDALVEGIDEKNKDLLTGRLSNNVMVHFPGDVSLIGTIVPVKLEQSKGFYYIGTKAE